MMNERYKKGLAVSLSVHICCLALIGILSLFTWKPTPTEPIYDVKLIMGEGGSGAALLKVQQTATQEKTEVQPEKEDIVEKKKEVSKEQEQKQQPEARQSTADIASNAAEPATANGPANGDGIAAGNGVGEGQGYGEGAGSGQGSGYSGVPGKGSQAFDVNGFWAAVNENKQYPFSAVKRHLQGTVGLSTTLDTEGNCLGVSVTISSGYNMLDEAAVAAVRAACPYPNASGMAVTINTKIMFALN